MRHEKFRAVLEDLGFLVLRVAGGRDAFYVRHADSRPLGFYRLDEHGAFHSGWVEHERGDGRTDCIDWPTLYDLVTRRKP